MVAGYSLRAALPEELESLYAIHRAAMERYVTETWRSWDRSRFSASISGSIGRGNGGR